MFPWIKPRSRRGYTLRRRLFIVQLAGTLIPLFLLGLISYYTIYSILENRIEKGIEKNLYVEKMGIENVLNNLDTASKQLSYGDFGFNISEFLLSADQFSQSQLKQKIDKSVELVLYTNPNIGTLFYYNPDSKQYIFNYYIKKNMDPLAFPVLTSREPYVQYYAPHESLNFIDNKPVFSVVRKLSTPNSPSPFVVYLEANSSATGSLFNSDQYGYPITRVLIDREGLVQYTEDAKLLPLGTVLAAEPGNARGTWGKHLQFSQSSDMGWTLVGFIQTKHVEKEITGWMFRFLLIGLISLLISMLLAWFAWRTIYHPLNRFKNEIGAISNNQLDGEVARLGVVEFDDLLRRFGDMKGRILQLLTEVEQKEKKKRHLEVEKLMHQINPHFLHNTLNTIQWIALMNGQHEIVKLVKVFTRVLNYNLGKEGGIVTVQQELNALQDYIELQQIRYNSRFQIHIQAEDRAQPLNLPRFLLQPLVENALYHAFQDEDGEIRVEVRIDDTEHLKVTVTDNGKGMTKETIHSLLSAPSDRTRKSGIGIGLNYVNNLIQVYYGDQYRLQIESTLGAGTRMIIRIPTGITLNPWEGTE